ncbi:E3 UFM1-protein ligase 1 [Dissophora ornata]|nr:E3 UFM1-protein ligase 1 [Dissophora ornata]
MGPLLDRSLKNLVSWRLSFGDSNQMNGQDEDDDPYIIGERGSSLKGIAEHVLNMQIPQRKSGGKARNGQAGGGKNGSKKKKQTQDFLTVQDVKEEIKQLEPDFDPGLVNATAGILYRDLVQNLKDRNRSVVLNQMQEEEDVEVTEDKERHLENKSILSAIQSLSKRIELSSRGIDVFEDSSVRNSLSKYLLQSWCVELLDLAVLHLASLDTAVTDELSDATSTRERLKTAYAEHRSQIDKSSSGQGPFVISMEDTIALLKLIPQDTADPLKKLRKLAAGGGKQKNLIEYLDIWSSLSQNSKLSLNIISSNEKDDRQWIAEHMEELHQILAGIEPFSDPALMLHIVTLIAFQQWTGRMLHASGKYVPRVLRQLRLSVDQQDGTIILQLDLLEKMLDSVLSNVKQQQQEGGDQGNNQDDLSQLWQSVYDLGTTLSSS